jgi:hypothetical protein
MKALLLAIEVPSFRPGDDDYAKSFSCCSWSIVTGLCRKTVWMVPRAASAARSTAGSYTSCIAAGRTASSSAGKRHTERCATAIFEQRHDPQLELRAEWRHKRVYP